LDALTRRRDRLARAFGAGLLATGVATLAALLLSYLIYPQIEPLIDRVFHALAKAPDAFPDARAFYSYQFVNGLIFGLMALGSGAVFWLAIHRARPWRGLGRHQWLALALVPVDLMIASWGFNPASDPLLLDFTPPAIQWLMQQPGDWRFTTLDDPQRPPILNANAAMRYGLDDIRGYESIIPRQYVD